MGNSSRQISLTDRFAVPQAKAAAIAGEPPSPSKPEIEIDETATAAEPGAAEGSAASTPGGGGSGDTPSSTPASTPAADVAPAAQAAATADGAKADGEGATTPSSVTSKPPPGPVRSAKERQLGGAWGQLCKSVEKNQVATYQNVEKEVANVGKVLQANAAACQEVTQPPPPP